MSKIIIGIHGLGNKPSKQTLEKWWKEAMCEGLTLHGFSDKIPDFEMVYWADLIYDKPLDENITDCNSPYYIDQQYIPAPPKFAMEQHNLRRKILNFVKSNLDKIFLDDNFNIKYVSVVDAIINRYFKEVGMYYSEESSAAIHNVDCSTRKAIRERAAEVIRKHRNREIFLVAHSMGTIIAYDVLTFETAGVPVDTFITMGSPLGLPVIKSKIVKETKVKLSDKPLLPTPSCIKKFWFNFSDLEDKIAVNYDIMDEFCKNTNGIEVKDFIVNNDYVANQVRNPHSVYGYLRTLEFSTVLSKFIKRKEATVIQKLIIWFKEISDIFHKRWNLLTTLAHENKQG